MKVNKLIIRFTVVVFLLTIGMGFLSTVKASDKDTLIMAMHAPLKTLDPHNNTALTAQINALLIYDELFSEAENLEIRPQMVDKWSLSSDKLTYTFTLRDGLRFHDGQPVTTADVIASLRRWSEGDPVGKMLMNRTSQLKKVDDKTFQIILKEPFGPTLYALARTRAFIMPERIAKTPISEQVSDYTGSGPFIFVKDEFKPGDQAVFVKNEAYVPRKEPPSAYAGGKVAYMKRIVWKNIPDQLTAINALKAGEIDYLEVLPIDLIPMVKDQKDIIVDVLNIAGRQGMLRMNWLHPPFNKDPRIRRAVGYAINQIDYLKATYGDPKYYRVCKSIYASQSPFTTDSGTEGMMEGNTKKAEALLKEAGYDGTPVVIINPTDVSYLAPYGLVVTQALRKAGFKVDLQSMDWGTVANRRGNQGPVSEGGWNIFHTSWTTDNMANPLINRPLACTGRQAWFGWPEDKQLQEWINQYPNLLDPAEQKKLTEKIQVRAYELGVHYPVGEFLTPSGYRNNIKDVMKASNPVFWNMKRK